MYKAFIPSTNKSGSTTPRSYNNTTKMKIFLLRPFSFDTANPITQNRVATQDSRKRKNAGNRTWDNRNTGNFVVTRLLSGREGALVNDVLGVLLFDFAGAVERGAGKGHETCLGDWLAFV